MIPNSYLIVPVVTIVVALLILVSPWILFRKYPGKAKPWFAGFTIIIITRMIVLPFIGYFLALNNEVALAFLQTLQGTFLIALATAVIHLVARWVIVKGVLRTPGDKHPNQHLYTMGLGQAGLEGLILYASPSIQLLRLIQMINRGIEQINISLAERDKIIEYIKTIPYLQIAVSAFSLFAIAGVYVFSTWAFVSGLRLNRSKLIWVSFLVEFIALFVINASHKFLGSWVALLAGIAIAVALLSYMFKIQKENQHERF